MFNLHPDSIRQWSALLPADFQEAIGTEASGDADRLSELAELINKCQQDDVLNLAREIALEVSSLSKAQRIRWIAWVARHTTLKKFSEFFRDLMTESEDGEGAHNLAIIFAEDIASIAFVIGTRVSSNPSIETALAIIAEASRQYDASPEYLS